MSYAFTMPAEELSYSDFTRRAAVRPSHLALASNGKFNSALFQRHKIIQHISLGHMNSLQFRYHELLQSYVARTLSQDWKQCRRKQ